jgi:CRISPR/Cas system CSM-associated protein Csm5 (group 7 of RAMP superfamily)
VVREVLSRSDRVTFLGLAEEDRQALLDELREHGHDHVADRLEALEADIARMAIRKQARQQEQEQERQQEQARQQEQERQQAQEQERQQAQEQELDINEQIRREIEERYRQLQEKLRQQRERGLGWGAEL